MIRVLIQRPFMPGSDFEGTLSDAIEMDINARCCGYDSGGQVEQMASKISEQQKWINMLVEKMVEAGHLSFNEINDMIMGHVSPLKGGDGE